MSTKTARDISARDGATAQKTAARDGATAHETAARDGATAHETAARDGHTEHMLPEREVRFSPTVHWSQRRPLGLGPASLLAGLAGATFVFALVLFAIGSWIAGLVFLVVSAIEICLFLVAVRREPEAPSARVAVTAADRADRLGRLMAVTISAGSRTALELARIWQLRRRLRTRFKRHLAPLGEAVYHDDPARAAQLKEQAHQLDEALREAELRASEAKAALRLQIERERATSQRTERLPLVEERPGSTNG